MEKENKMPGSFPGQETPSKFKTLPAHQFCYVREITNKKEAGADLAFKELLNQINDPNKELIFIPVNNPNFHWSLLVYETKSKGFYHWDTLRGANWRYVKDSVYKLLGELQVPRHEWDKHFIAKHKIKQNNGWECGLCVVGIMKRVREKYSGSMENIELGEFSFEKEREELKEKYLKENG
ncbi:9179_t:CDS:1 [Racocetra persica]|uniref:9179_t:CDS:1 n=1 Tax=Racocetra persica TaxID=160502 RepID=A0ACA9RQP0_9GLOM|nr:9179_t:CDS:1 [Racocetra persica]